jgi:hypothetical protein
MSKKTLSVLHTHVNSYVLQRNLYLSVVILKSRKIVLQSKLNRKCLREKVQKSITVLHTHTHVNSYVLQQNLYLSVVILKKS